MGALGKCRTSRTCRLGFRFEDGTSCWPLSIFFDFIRFWLMPLPYHIP